jgi:hypothetical protein
MNVLHNIMTRDGTPYMEDWRYSEHITAPRPSCVGTPGFKLRRLRVNFPEIIGRYLVRRIATTKPDCYVIGERRYTLQAALDIVEGRVQITFDKPVQLPLPIGDAA